MSDAPPPGDPKPRRPSTAQLVRRLGSDGWLPWRRFMEAALYDPDFGYYTTAIRDVGARRGDFSTTPTLHRALGESVAAWIGRQTAMGDDRTSLSVIEVGAGNGALADAVLDSLGWLGRRRIRYRIVEASPILANRQQERGSLRRRVRAWHRTITEALAAIHDTHPGTRRLAVISNELVDAFPASAWRWDARSARWDELGLEIAADGTIVESPRPAAVGGAPDSTAADPDAWPQRRPPEGQRIEVHDSFRRWLEAWIPDAPPRLDLLTIDYGDRFPAVYHRRPTGTLRGYHHHFPVHGPELHTRPGRQDLTADVNFSDLEAWNARFGLDTVAFSTQRTFILDHLGRPPGPIDRRDPKLDFILAADGAGTAFKVLHSRRCPIQTRDPRD